MPLGEMENKVAVSRRTVAQAVFVRDFALAVLIIGLAIVFAVVSATGIVPLKRPHLAFVMALVVALVAAAWLVFQRVRMPRSREGIVDAQRLAGDLMRQRDQS